MNKTRLNKGMMKAAIILIIALMIPALVSYADKKMVISNSDTGESFEVSVPEGTEIYEYNSNWLDSFPYLLEHARYGEPWAYEALGDCYRYGRGGVKQSIINAFTYYTLAGLNVEEIVGNTVEVNPKDQLCLIYKLIGKVEASECDEILPLVDTLDQVHYTEADILRDFINNPDTISLSQVVERNLLYPDVPVDKMIFTFAGCMLCNYFPEKLCTYDDQMLALASNYPFSINHIAREFLDGNHEEMDSVTIAEKSTIIIRSLENADKEAMLNRDGAGALYNHFLSEMEAGRMAYDEDNMKRLATLAGLPE